MKSNIYMRALHRDLINCKINFESLYIQALALGMHGENSTNTYVSLQLNSKRMNVIPKLLPMLFLRQHDNAAFADATILLLHLLKVSVGCYFLGPSTLG
jgi:hypothetical protein